MNIINSKFSMNVRDTLFKSFKQFKQDPNQLKKIEQNASDSLSSEFQADENDSEMPFFDPTNPIKMIQFLEYVILNESDNADESIFNSLLDCYLIKWKKASESTDRATLRNKIMSLLLNDLGKYSFEQAMISCRMNHFIDGLLFLYEQMQLYDLILDHYVEIDDVNRILETCEKFSDQDERLWIRAFWYFAKTSDVDISLLHRVLEEVDKRNLIPPISIIDILSRNSPTATLAAIKNYLSQWLTKNSEMVSKNYDLIHQYQDSTEKMRDEIESIRTQPKIFQSSRCSFCKVHLELPSIHFLCGHSYHQGCLESPSDEKGCPLCLPEQTKLSNMSTSRKDQDLDLLSNQ